MYKKLVDLIDLKTILSLCCMGLLIYMTVADKVDIIVTTNIINSVFTYYFTRINLDSEDTDDEQPTT